MAASVFTLNYIKIENVAFPTAAGMNKYLAEEREIWTPFLEEVRANNQLQAIQLQNGGTTATDHLADAFKHMTRHADNLTAFNRAPQSPRASVILPPPSSSIEGQLILGLYSLNRNQDAVACYLWFLTQNKTSEKTRIQASTCTVEAKHCQLAHTLLRLSHSTAFRHKS
ncbi:MAG: hypothetical protein ABJ251_22780 [Paracoccaceae bacterium]